MKKFAAFDIDGTLFRSGLYREVVFEMIRQGTLSDKLLDLFAEKESLWQRRAHGNAFKEFEQAMAEAFDAELPRIRISDFETAATRVIEAKKDNVYAYTRDLARSLKDRGYLLIAISGSQAELVQPFAEYYGFDLWVGQTYERGEEFFTGEIVKTHNGKDVFLRRLIDQHGLALKDSVAVGDSSGDIEMLGMVEQPIAFNPEADFLEVAMRRGWKVVVERKNVIYELEPSHKGYVLTNGGRPS